MFEQGVTYDNAPEKLRELGVALGVDVRTQAEIKRQELQAARAAAYVAAGRPFNPVNIG
ncbi:MAG: hypothetical protein NDI90_21770 [Nitrospira sp. BO4]|jgi:hypothetical protein|nr:hypothetical protein [Nitrospira sp. BO4]